MGVWEKVPLGEVLHRVDRFENKNELQEYQFAGTYSFARGIFVGDNKLGSTFGLKKIQRIHEGDFIYCKIMAWEGAFGLAPKETDNCVMSGAFVVYEIDKKKVSPKFLDYYFKRKAVWKSIGSQSTGTNVNQWQWSFLGANTTTSTDENPTLFKYAADGTYTITLNAGAGLCTNTTSTMVISGFFMILIFEVTGCPPAKAEGN